MHGHCVCGFVASVCYVCYMRVGMGIVLECVAWAHVLHVCGCCMCVSDAWVCVLHVCGYVCWRDECM